MRTIWKFTLATTPSQELRMPVGAEALCLQMQFGMPQVWALVDPKAFAQTRRFATYGTGHDMPEAPGRYVGSYQLDGGAFVFHVFEEAA